ncbi:hypothetical protein SADUNF_Sadunf14G0056400 [Salix dunnii]|uniref:Uncharacterized protein n=1 Tax=Salix dunnii TaxID=1413687 RepID=A0A835MJL5_9ROSI|nr:hypothetical protein SADUNF_Sadunf14G0056400 [Salix dunnii]
MAQFKENKFSCSCILWECSQLCCFTPSGNRNRSCRVWAAIHWAVKKIMKIGCLRDMRKESKAGAIRGWAPQLLILEHEAGGFVTPCNFRDRDEKLATGILNIGDWDGAQKWASMVGDRVKNGATEKAIMEGKEAEKKWQSKLLNKVGLLILISILSLKS